MRRALGEVRWSGILTDLLVLAGVLVIVYGAWMIYPPAGVITGGLMCIGIGIARAKNEPNR